MGRKGVAKRKSSKVKDKESKNGSTGNTVASLTRASETPLARVVDKGNAISSDKGGKKKR